MNKPNYRGDGRDGERLLLAQRKRTRRMQRNLNNVLKQLRGTNSSVVEYMLK